MRAFCLLCVSTIELGIWVEPDGLFWLEVLEGQAVKLVARIKLGLLA